MNSKKRLWLYLLGFVALFAVAAGVYQSAKSSHELAEQEALQLAETESLAAASIESETEALKVEEELLEESASMEASLSEKPKIASDAVPNNSLLDAEGNEVKLHDFIGKPMIINLWASWCPPCREEMPYFESAYQEYGDEVNFIMLNATDSRGTESIEVANEFLEEIGAEFPVYYDLEFENQLVFGSNMLPMTIVLNEDGSIHEYIRGTVSQAKLDSVVTTVLHD